MIVENTNFKKIWWCILLIIFSILFFKVKAPNIKFFIIMYISVITLMPFYNEIDIFGFKLKKEIVGLQKELNEVKNNMILANTNNQTLYNILPTPSSDEKLNEIAKNLEKLTNHNKVHINTDEVVDIPENNLFLFKVRYSIENEINRIVKQMNSKNGLGLNLYRMTLTLKLSALLEEDVIDSVLFETLREVIIICDAGVYREVIQKNKIQFVRKTMTKTIELLRSINI